MDYYGALSGNPSEAKRRYAVRELLWGTAQSGVDDLRILLGDINIQSVVIDEKTGNNSRPEVVRVLEQAGFTLLDRGTEPAYELYVRQGRASN
jgi:hypothetical protein